MELRTCLRRNSANACGTFFAIFFAMKSSSLNDAFIEDHQTLTRGLSRLLSLVEQRHYDESARVAKELDPAVGPHIEFEEKSFYPQVR